MRAGCGMLVWFCWLLPLPVDKASWSLGHPPSARGGIHVEGKFVGLLSGRVYDLSIGKPPPLY